LNRLLTLLVWVMVAIVLSVAVMRVMSVRKHRSADQKILIEKSKQRD
jgi:heme/copper-type cytochrome/quinol oxidase subunit 2